MYKVIDLKTWNKRKQFEWFNTFSNPCYGFNTDIDVTEVVNFSKKTKTYFMKLLTLLILL